MATRLSLLDIPPFEVIRTRRGWVTTLKDRPSGQTLIVSTVDIGMAFCPKVSQFHDTPIMHNEAFPLEYAERRNAAYTKAKELASKRRLEVLACSCAIYTITRSRQLLFQVFMRFTPPVPMSETFHFYVAAMVSQYPVETMEPNGNYDWPFYAPDMSAIELRRFFLSQLKTIPIVLVQILSPGQMQWVETQNARSAGFGRPLIR